MIGFNNWQLKPAIAAAKSAVDPTGSVIDTYTSMREASQAKGDGFSGAVAAVNQINPVSQVIQAGSKTYQAWEKSNYSEVVEQGLNTVSSVVGLVFTISGAAKMASGKPSRPGVTVEGEALGGGGASEATATSSIEATSPARIGTGQTHYKIGEGVRRSVAAREVGHPDIAARVKDPTSGKFSDPIRVPLDQLHVGPEKAAIPRDPRWLNIFMATGRGEAITPIDVSPLGLGAEKALVPVLQVKLLKWNP